MTGMVGHGSRVLRYWQARDARTSAPDAIRALADGIKEDTAAWIEVSAKEFRQAPSFKPVAEAAAGETAVTEMAGNEKAGSPGAAHRMDPRMRAQLLDAIRHHRRSIVPLEQRDEWSRFVLHTGHLYAFHLPPLQQTHPAARESFASTAVIAPVLDQAPETEQAERHERISATTQGRRSRRNMERVS
jgi:hypothetical protein